MILAQPGGVFHHYFGSRCWREYPALALPDIGPAIRL
jgi:hypothetical protein